MARLGTYGPARTGFAAVRCVGNCVRLTADGKRGKRGAALHPRRVLLHGMRAANAMYVHDTRVDCENCARNAGTVLRCAEQHDMYVGPGRSPRRPRQSMRFGAIQETTTWPLQHSVADGRRGTRG